MSHKMIILTAFGGVLLVGMACSFPVLISGPTSTPPQDRSAPTGTASPVVIGLPLPKPEPAAGTVMTWIDNSDFVYVPSSEFIMGVDRPEGGDDTPAHHVDLAGFWIHQAEVTNGQYAQCVDVEKCSPPHKETNTSFWYTQADRANDPIVGVDWEQAQAYCDWIKARLPTEAEWEKAARGTEAKPFPWGDAEPTCDLLNFKDCLKPAAPTRVRSYPNGASPFQLMDTAGNVFEWVNDWYAADYYPISPLLNPTGPAEGIERIIRGSSYLTKIDSLQVTLRSFLKPEKHRADLGFRCVLLGKPQPPACQLPPEGGPPNAEMPDITVTGVGYCDGSSDDPNTGVNFTVEYSMSPEGWDVSFTPMPGIICDRIPGEAIRYNCHGTGVRQDTTVMIDICPYALTPSCGPGYTYNPETKLCDYGPSSSSTGGCEAGMVEIPDLGCVPIPSAGSCPPGYYHYLSEGDEFCIPLDPACNYATLGIDDPECEICPTSFTFLPNLQCCSSPQGYPSTCRIGHDFVELADGSRYCGMAGSCKTLRVYVPLCPTPTPPPRRQCFCCEFTSRTACNAHANDGCSWVTLGPAAYCSGP
jgi:formylglycine-generating enzyme required for sulfatase activity